MVRGVRGEQKFLSLPIPIDFLTVEIRAWGDVFV